MADRETMLGANQKARFMLKEAGIAITEEEAKSIEFCDYGLEDFDRIGTEILIYVNTDRVCAKEMVLTPYQICPQHIHPQIGNYQGKEETFRCRWGEVYLYVQGEAAPQPAAKVPESRKEYFTVWHEIILRPGEQFTLKENMLHWFQAGPEGAVISEFSTPSFDDKDIFTDPHIKRQGFYG